MKIAVAGASGTVGHHAVDAAHARGHEVVRVSRSDGVDLTTGHGLVAALDGAEVIVDVSNAGTIEEQAATEFFTAVARNLQAAAAEHGVQHVVTLSIVGIDNVPFGYYNSKLVHEHVAAAGPVPSTILRATQLHEFPAQLLAMQRGQDPARVFDVTVQTVAAAAVADALLEVANKPPQGRGTDVAGPETASLVDLARAFVARHGPALDVQPDTDTMAGTPDDALLAGPDARIVGPTFADWLDSTDAAALGTNRT